MPRFALIISYFLSVFVTTGFCVGPAIVFIHIGPQLPPYLSTAVSQARLFNPEVPIYLIASEAAFNSSDALFVKDGVQFAPCERLEKNWVHRRFLKTAKYDKRSYGGLWFFAIERFFYLAALMHEQSLSDVFHMENDVMLYADLEELLPVLRRRYKGKIGIPFDNDTRGIASLIYVSGLRPLDRFLKFVVDCGRRSDTDMSLLSRFRHELWRQWTEPLPIGIPQYGDKHPFISPAGHRPKNPELFVVHADEFCSFFDAAAIGQYLGGIDPIHRSDTIGFINESCVVNPSHFQYEWVIDEKGRRVPEAIFEGVRWRINNLHVHSKNLTAFRS
ncbi:MAG: hypothetical protein RL235_721, partial [Chlamydiota bacterium]